MAIEARILYLKKPSEEHNFLKQDVRYSMLSGFLSSLCEEKRQNNILN